MKAVNKHSMTIILVAGFALFIGFSLLTGVGPGKEMAGDFGTFFVHMVAILPCVFVLIGLFDVWVKRETVEKHLGNGAGLLPYIWAALLAGTSVGGLHVALPIAHALWKKGAHLGVVVAYLTCAGICRVPMALFEASFLGWRFTFVRFAISLPLALLTSAVIGLWFERNGYRLPESE